MIANAYYEHAIQGAYEHYDLGDLVLEEGETLRGAKLAYRTFGKLNAAKDNAILCTTWYSGTGKILEDVYIGEDHALDPSKYFIIIAEQIGGGISSSPHNTPAPQSMGKFPRVRIGDDVRAQHQLITEHFGIEKLVLVFGGSMGGQQVYEWAVRYPDMMERVAPLAATAQISDHQVVFTDTLTQAITSDPAWNDGWYETGDVRVGLDRLAMVVANLGFSTEFYQQKRWQSTLGFASLQDFLNGLLHAYYEPMDPNVLLWQQWKWQRADVARHTKGDLASALGRIKAKTMVMPISHDMFFPPDECEAEAKLIANAEFRVINCPDGHLGLHGFEPAYMEQINKNLTELLSN